MAQRLIMLVVATGPQTGLVAAAVGIVVDIVVGVIIIGVVVGSASEPKQISVKPRK